jgi:hypothetical protein
MTCYLLQEEGAVKVKTAKRIEPLTEEEVSQYLSFTTPNSNDFCVKYFQNHSRWQ